MLKLKSTFIRLACLFIIFFLLSPADSKAQSPLKLNPIPAHRVADYIHAVIATARTFYSLSIF